MTTLLVMCIGAFCGLIIGFTAGAYYGARAENRRLLDLLKARFPSIQFQTLGQYGHKHQGEQILDRDQFSTGTGEPNKLH